MNKQEYMVPEIRVRSVRIHTYILSNSGKDDSSIEMELSDTEITDSREILTKGRFVFDEDDAFGMHQW